MLNWVEATGQASRMRGCRKCPSSEPFWAKSVKEKFCPFTVCLMLMEWHCRDGRKLTAALVLVPHSPPIRTLYNPCSCSFLCCALLMLCCFCLIRQYLFSYTQTAISELLSEGHWSPEMQIERWDRDPFICGIKCLHLRVILTVSS